MKYLIGFSLAVLLGIGQIASASATLLGDTLTVRRAFPDVGTTIGLPVDTVVAVGIGDRVTPQPHLYEVDPEAFSILIDFNQGDSSGFIPDGAGGFDGLVFTGISNTLLSVSASVDTFGIVESVVLVGNDIHLDLGGNFSADPGSILLDLEFEAVPEPAGLALLAIGLVAVGSYRSRNRWQNRS